VAETGLDMVQLSGNEPPELCLDITVPVIKTLHVGPGFNHNLHEHYTVHAFLLDTHQSDRFGGTGRTFNWPQVRPEIFKRPIILSGGLTPDNVTEGIKTLQPSAVDLNSGIEVRPGVKDRAKMERLFRILEKIEGSHDQIF
jgi:phosphoribosylanthranilate isomerase